MDKQDRERYREELRSTLEVLLQKSRDEENRLFDREVWYLLFANSSPELFDRLLRFCMYERVRPPPVHVLVGSRYQNPRFLDSLEATDLGEPFWPFSGVYRIDIEFKPPECETPKAQVLEGPVQLSSP